MLINFITALAWIIAVGLGGWLALLFVLFMSIRGAKLKIGFPALISVAASIAWLIAKYTTQ